MQKIKKRLLQMKSKNLTFKQRVDGEDINIIFQIGPTDDSKFVNDFIADVLIDLLSIPNTEIVQGPQANRFYLSISFNIDKYKCNLARLDNMCIYFNICCDEKYSFIFTMNQFNEILINTNYKQEIITMLSLLGFFDADSINNLGD